MIKLFWNTHNQKKPSSEDKTIREKQELDYGWGQYHKKSSDKWIYEILKKIKYNIIESITSLEKEDILIIVVHNIIGYIGLTCCFNWNNWNLFIHNK